MDAEYPEHLLAREPAPPYKGEGPFALWHFSENPSLVRFGRIRRPPTGSASVGMGGRYWPCTDIPVPERLPARMHLAGAGHRTAGS